MLTAVLLHLPIGITYLSALRSQGPIGRSGWLKSIGVLVVFFAGGVAYPNLHNRDKNSPHPFAERQMGPFAEDAKAEPAP